ncbi:MAG: hypothetical protein HYZ50_17165 [Deltaproteobacteria bacterium]|nr:hypothetical protein [Deltaproteobacteria bacterium]
MRVCVLTNLRAGRKNARLQRVLTFLKSRPDILHLETESYRHVREALDLLAHKGMEVLAVNGGDGTLQHALTELLRAGRFSSPPLIAPLRGGRTNMNALVLGSHPDPVMALTTLLAAVRDGSLMNRVVRQPVLRVEYDPEAEPQFGLFFGVGLLHRAIERKHRLLPKRRLQGLPGAATFLGTMLARAAFGSESGLLAPDYMTVTLDQSRSDWTRYLLFMATALERLFFHLRPFWGTEEAPIHCTAIAPGARRTLGAAFRILRGHAPYPYPEVAGYFSRNVHRLELRLDCGLLLDGELFAPQPGRVVRVTTDQRLRFVQTRT